MTLTCKLDYGNDKCVTTGMALPKPHIRPMMTLPVVALPRSDIGVGETLNFTVTVSIGTESVSAYTQNPQEVMAGGCTQTETTTTCDFAYTNASGAGAKPFVVDYYNTCEGTKHLGFTITVH